MASRDEKGGNISDPGKPDAPVKWRPEVVDPTRKIYQQQHLSAQKNEEAGKRTVMPSQAGGLPHTTVKSSYSEKVLPASRMSVTSCITPLPPFSQVTVPFPRMDKPISKPVDKMQTVKASDPAVTVSSVGQVQLVQACQDVIPHGEEARLHSNQTGQTVQQTLNRQSVAQGQTPQWNVQNRLQELSVHQSQSGTIMQQNPNTGSLQPNPSGPGLHHTPKRSDFHQNPSGTDVQPNQTGPAPHDALSGVVLHQTSSVTNIKPAQSRASMHHGQHVQSLQQNQSKEGIQLHTLQQVLQPSGPAAHERMHVQVQKAGQNAPHVVPMEHRKVGMFLQRTEDQSPSSGHSQQQDHISVIQGSLSLGAQAPNVVMTPSTTPHPQTKELNSGLKYLSQMQVVTQLNPLQSQNGPLLAFPNNSPLIVQSSSRPLVVPPASRATQLPGVNQLLLQSSTGLTVYPYHTPVGSITTHNQVRSPGKQIKMGFSRTYDRPQSHHGLVRPVASPAQNTNNANISVTGGQINSFQPKSGSVPNQLLQGKSTETSRAHVQLIIGPEVISSSRVHTGSLQPQKGQHVLPEPKTADAPKVLKYGIEQLTPLGQNNEGFPNKKMNENTVISMPVPQTSKRNSATVTSTSQSAQIIAPLGLPAKRLTEEQIRAELAKSQLDLQRAKNELYQYFEQKSSSAGGSVIYQAAVNTPTVISPVVSNTNVLNTKRPSVPLPQVSHFVSPPPPMKSLTVLYQAADAQSVDPSPVTNAAVQQTETSVRAANNTMGMTYMGHEHSVHQDVRTAVIPQQPVSNVLAAQPHLSAATVPQPPVSVPAVAQLPVITVAGPLPVLPTVSVAQPVTRIVPIPESLSRSEADAHSQIQELQIPAKTILSNLLTGTQSSNQADGIKSLAVNTTTTMQNPVAGFSGSQPCNVSNENHSVHPANNSFDQRPVASASGSQSQSATSNVSMVSSAVTNMNNRTGHERPEKDQRLDQLETQGSDPDLNAQRNKKFTVSYKLEAVQYAKQTSKSEASKKYGVNHRQITQWCQQEEKLSTLLKGDQGNRMRSPGGGRKLLFSSLDKRLLEWLHDYRRDSNRITAKAIMMKAKEIHEESGEESQKFVASNGWFQRFLLRNNLTLKQLNDPDFVLPTEVEKTMEHQLSITSANQSVEESSTPSWPEHAVDMLVEAASVVSQGTTEAEIIGPAMYIVTPDTVPASSADQDMDEKSMEQLANEEILEISPRRSGNKQGLKKSSCFHKSYTISFKLEAVKYAKQTTKETAARKFKVNSKQIRDWCKKEERLRKMLNNQEGGRRKLTGCGRKAFSHMLEKMLVSWIMQCRKNNLRISRAQIKRKAQEIYQSGMVTDATWENFHASDGWLCKFLWRHRASMKTINSDDPFSNPEPPTKEEPAVTNIISGSNHAADQGDSDDPAAGDHGNKFGKRNTNNTSSTITTKAMVKEMPECTSVRRSLRAPSKRKFSYPMDESASDEEETISGTRKKRIPQVNKASAVTAAEEEPIREKSIERDNVDTYEEMGAPAVHKAYSVAFKLRAVDHAKHTSKIATAKAFKVDPKQIRHWCQNESQLREALARNEGDRKRMGGGGRKGMGGLLDEKLLKWIKQCKEEDTFISSALIRQKALAILQECKEGVTSDIKFSASQGWLKNFLARNKLSLHQLSAADIGDESVEGQGQSDSQGQADSQGQDEKQDDTTLSPASEATVSAVIDTNAVPSHNLRRRTKMRLTQKMISEEREELDEEQLSPADDIGESIKFESKAKESSEESSKMSEILLGAPTDMGSTRYKKYNVYYKLEAVEFARKQSKSAAAKRYKVDMKRIREWCKDEDKLRALLTKNEGFRTRTVGAGRKGVGSCLDEKLLAWMNECYKDNVKFTGAMISKKALEIYASMEGDTPVKEFTASKGWLARFLLRHKISLRPKGSQLKKQDSHKIMPTTQPVVAECSEGSLESASTVSATGTEDPKSVLYSTQSYIGEVYYVSPMQASSSTDTYTTASHMYQAPPTSCSDSVGGHPQFARDVYNSDDSHPLSVYRNLHNTDTNTLGSYTNMQNMETQNVLPDPPQHPADGLTMSMPTQVFSMVEPSSSMQNANQLTSEPQAVLQQNATQHQMEPPNNVHDATRPGTDPQSVNSDEAPTYANLRPHDPRPPVTDTSHLPPGPSPHPTEDVNSRQEYGQENYNDMVQRHAEDEIRQWVLGYMAQMANLSTQQTQGNYSTTYQQ